MTDKLSKSENNPTLTILALDRDSTTWKLPIVQQLCVCHQRVVKSLY